MQPCVHSPVCAGFVEVDLEQNPFQLSSSDDTFKTHINNKVALGDIDADGDLDLFVG